MSIRKLLIKIIKSCSKQRAAYKYTNIYILCKSKYNTRDIAK